MTTLSKKPVPALFEDISREGFKTTWNHPAFPSWVTKKGKAKEEFYVIDLPVPKLAPFDAAYARISLKDNRIYCSIRFDFCQVFQDCMNNEEFIKVMDRKESQWRGAFREYFGTIAEYFCLEWEVEANEPLSEDEVFEMTFSLEGSFEAGCYTRVRTLLLEVMIKTHYNKHG